jgi:predicted RNase H-like HicB family nuclease
MKLRALLERGEDGWIVAECPSLPGCFSQGRTEAEAITNIKEGVEGWLQAEAEKHPPRSAGTKVVEAAI